jgi:hypothetical protein
MTSRDRIIIEIMELNPSASREFLAMFDEKALGQYRDHLVHATRPRGGTAGWIRPADARAVICRTSAA